MPAATVVRAERRSNTLTARPFHRMRMRGIAGVEFDLAVRDGLLDAEPQPGNVVSGMFFMTGNLGLAYP